MFSTCCQETEETLEHSLLHCPQYCSTRTVLSKMWRSSANEISRELALSALTKQPQYIMQFLLDPSVIPEVIVATQDDGVEVLNYIFHLTRTWCFSIHRERLKSLGRWNFRWTRGDLQVGLGLARKKSRTRGYKTHVPVKETGCDEMNILWPNDSIRFVMLGYKV